MAKNLPEREKMNYQSFQNAQIERLSEVYQSESLVIKWFLAAKEPRPLSLLVRPG
jgi:hypothetical protein